MNRVERAAWAALVRELRKEAKLDQEELAVKAGTTRRTIGAIERGEVVPQEEGLHRILDALGIDIKPEPAEDIKTFLSLITPLLERLSPEIRVELQPEIVRLVAEAFAPTTKFEVVTDEEEFDPRGKR